MKKFKEYTVNTQGIKSLSKALVKHAIHLGYNFDGDYDDYEFLCCFDDGECYLTDINHLNGISLDEFFELTPKDVVIDTEPETRLFRAYLMWSKNGLSEYNAQVTQDQIDRIKVIMNESDSPVRSVS